jgi:hypothetical protein
MNRVICSCLLGVLVALPLVGGPSQASDLGDLWWPTTKIQYFTQKPVPQGTVIKLRINKIGAVKANIYISEFLNAGGAPLTVESRDITHWEYNDITEGSVLTFTVPKTMRIGVGLRWGQHFIPPGGCGDNGHLPDPYLNWLFGSRADGPPYWNIDLKMVRPGF